MSEQPTAPVPPARLALQPRDHQGRVVPAFVAYVDGKPDHRFVRERFVRRAHEMRLCFLCDLPLGVHGAFMVGPMRMITRVTPQPPAHRTCAEYGMKACPHLNPEVSAVYITEEWSRHRSHEQFAFQNAFEVTWWIQGRRATYPEALNAVVSGLEILRAEADEDDNPERAHEILAKQYERALTLLPASGS